MQLIKSRFHICWFGHSFLRVELLHVLWVQSSVSNVKVFLWRLHYVPCRIWLTALNNDSSRSFMIKLIIYDSGHEQPFNEAMTNYLTQKDRWRDFLSSDFIFVIFRSYFQININSWVLTLPIGVIYCQRVVHSFLFPWEPMISCD